MEPTTPDLPAIAEAERRPGRLALARQIALPAGPTGPAPGHPATT